VNYYAGQLNITPKYLSEILLKQTGKAAKKWIEEHICMEAKSLLRQTAMSVQEICYWLGYEDTSYFTKTFKKWEGMTPLAYRSL
jgi:AraC-like DNA-binding protein